MLDKELIIAAVGATITEIEISDYFSEEIESITLDNGLKIYILTEGYDDPGKLHIERMPTP